MADEPTPTPQEPTTPTTPTPAEPAPPSPPTDPAPPADSVEPKPSLLEGDKPKEEPKPGDPKPEPVALDVKALKLPEGIKLADGSLDKFEPVAKELGLSQESAQKLLDFHLETLKQTTEASYRAFNELRDGWVTEVKADPEIGGDKLDKVTATVAKVLDQYGDPEVRKVLSYTGAGDNPAIIRTFYRMSKALTEGGHVQGSPPKPPAGPGAHALYPNLA